MGKTQVAYCKWDKFGTKMVTMLGQDFHLYLGQSWNLKTWDNIGTLDWDNTVFDHTPTCTLQLGQCCPKNKIVSSHYCP